MSNTTNTQATAEFLRGLGIDDDTATRAAGGLADAGLVTPDLPEPDEPDKHMPAWKFGDTVVSSTPDFAVMVMGPGGVHMYPHLDELDRYALALMAAAAKSREAKQQFTENMPGGTEEFDQMFGTAAGFFTY